jgi:hypothetical protein
MVYGLRTAVGFVFGHDRFMVHREKLCEHIGRLPALVERLGSLCWRMGGRRGVPMARRRSCASFRDYARSARAGGRIKEWEGC